MTPESLTLYPIPRPSHIIRIRRRAYFSLPDLLILSLGVRRSVISISWLRWCRLGIWDGAVVVSDFMPFLTSLGISVGEYLSYYTALDEAVLTLSLNSLFASFFSV